MIWHYMEDSLWGILFDIIFTHVQYFFKAQGTGVILITHSHWFIDGQSHSKAQGVWMHVCACARACVCASERVRCHWNASRILHSSCSEILNGCSWARADIVFLNFSWQYDSRDLQQRSDCWRVHSVWKGAATDSTVNCRCWGIYFDFIHIYIYTKCYE